MAPLEKKSASSVPPTTITLVPKVMVTACRTICRTLFGRDGMKYSRLLLMPKAQMVVSRPA